MSVLLIAGIVTKNPEFLRDLAAQEPWAYELAKAINMTPVSFYMEPYDHWLNGAPSWVLFIEESGIYCHTYPEKDTIEIILHSCKAIRDPVGVALAIIKKCGLAVSRYVHLVDWNWREYGEPTHEWAWPDQIRIRGEHYRRRLQVAG